MLRSCYDPKMGIENVLALLIAERDKLSRAIEALQGPTKRLGRPPKTAATVSAGVPVPAPTAPAKKKRHFSAAQREAAAERMRQRWAVKKKAAAKPSSKKKTAK